MTLKVPSSIGNSTAKPALANAGVRVHASDQHAADEQDYLYEVDRE